MVMCLAGIGIATWKTATKDQGSAVKSQAEPLNFIVDMKLPQNADGDTCTTLFNNGTDATSGGAVVGVDYSAMSHSALLL